MTVPPVPIVQASMSGNVRECPDLPGGDVPFSKTNPPPPDAGKTMPGNVRVCPDLPARAERNDKTNPPPVGPAMSANARKCTDLSGADRGNCKTNPPLTPRQVLAVQLLAAGVGFAATGRKLKVNERTVRRWMPVPAFAAELRRRLRAADPSAARGPDPSPPKRPPLPSPPPLRPRERGPYQFEGVTYPTFAEYMEAINQASAKHGLGLQPGGRWP